MKLKRISKQLYALFTVIGLVLLGIAPVAHAAASQMYLSPAGGSYTAGQSFTITIRVNAQTTVNAVQANLTYPTDKLDVSNLSYGGSAFDIQAESSAAGGSIRIGRGTVTSFSGDRLVASITFTAKTGSGSATVSFAGGSSLADNGVEVTSTKSGSTFSFYTPAAPAPTPAPTPTSSGSTKTTTSTTKTTTTASPTTTAAAVAPAPDTKKPEVSQVKVTSSAPGISKLAIQTSEDAQVVLEYGLTTTYGITVTDTKVSGTHELALDTKYMLPKTTYHYKLSITDAAGNNTITNDKTFTTPGLPASITVTGSDGKPLKGAKVTIDGETKLTNQKGIAMFDLSIGQKTATIQYGDKTILKTFVLGAETSTDKPMAVAGAIAAKASKPKLLYIGFATLLVLMGCAVFAFLNRSKLLAKLPKRKPPTKPNKPAKTPNTPKKDEVEESKPEEPQAEVPVEPAPVPEPKPEPVTQPKEPLVENPKSEPKPEVTPKDKPLEPPTTEKTPAILESEKSKSDKPPRYTMDAL
jgi:outer membrane biosynthesis protein TonB